MSGNKAKAPFTFCTRFHLTEATGFRAADIGELLALIGEVPGASIYHHTHRSLQQHELLSPEPPNDFAYWVAGELGEPELAERLASVDIVSFASIRALREKLASVIGEYLERYPRLKDRRSHPGREFYFLKSVSFVARTPYTATDLAEFAAGLRSVTLDSVYFHIFEPRLRLENATNDFSNWLERSMGEKAAADAIARIDPYTYALEDLRRAVLRIVEGKEAA